MDELKPCLFCGGKAGTMSKLEKFGGLYGHDGNIESIKYLGRKWEP